MNGFDLRSCYTEMESVTQQAHTDAVFELLADNPDWPFVPVVDHWRRPVGVVRERRLKGYAYSRFGRELIQRHTLQEFIDPILVLPSDVSLSDLLMSGADNPNPDGILVVEGGAYRAVVLNAALFRLYAERHTETQVRLANSEKMEAIGTLAGGIAHDLNNMLTPIIGYSELIRDMVHSGDAVRPEMIDEVLVSAARAQQTVRQILAFSRHQEAERFHTRVSDAIREVVRLMRPSLPATIDIEMRIETARDMILASPTELHQLLVNLCTNAYHAVRTKGGLLVLSVCDHEGPLHGWSLHSGPVTAPLLRLSVTDTGVGIDPAILPRVFEPFFTTKPQGEGTGMGLAIVHGIVSRLGGFISVESGLDLGTSFHVYLPHAPGGMAAAAPSQPCTLRGVPAVDNASASGGPTAAVRVLVVDDESSITRLAKVVMSRHGIEVSTENDSQRAWETLRADPDQFDVLVTDHLMPGITGAELVRLLREIRPDFPAIICTGYSEAVTPEQARDLGIRERLLKPVDFRQVATLIKRLMSTPAALGDPHPMDAAVLLRP